MAQLFIKKRGSANDQKAVEGTDDGEMYIQLGGDDAGLLADILAKLSGPGEDASHSGQKVVTIAGTAEAVGGDVATKGLVIIADPDNGGNIYVGDSSIDESGAKLPPGGILPCGAVNLSRIYIDADNSGEGISYYYTV
jgi:hypothetical protein